MNEVEFFEQDLMENGKSVGKVAIFRGGLNNENPSDLLEKAVSKYVGNRGYNEFVEINLDNPWVRIIVLGINDPKYKKFKL